MKNRILLSLICSLYLCSIFAQLPTKIEISNCGYSANDIYIAGPNVDGCQCFDRVNGNDRIAVYTQANSPDSQNFIFDAGRTCAQGGPVINNVCLSGFVSEYCHIVDSHGSPNCNNCIVTVLEREPCFDSISLNDIVIPTDTYKTTQQISSNGIVDANTSVLFRSNEILLHPDFEVLKPAKFEALIDPDECDNYFCPPFEDAPTFLQSFPDLSVNSDENCEAIIQIPFQIDYDMPNNLSVRAYGIDQYFIDFMFFNVELVSVNGSISNYLLIDTLPLGTYYVDLEVKDSNCNLSVDTEFNIIVNNSGMIPTFVCKELAIPLSDSLNVKINSSDIVCVTDPNACDPSSNRQLISSFSIDPNDVDRTYDCSDIGDVLLTMFTWDVLDNDNDGVLDTMLRQICFATQALYDPNNYCNP